MAKDNSARSLGKFDHWGQAQKFDSAAIGPGDISNLEELRSRMRWLQDTAGTANLAKGMEKVRAELQHMSARVKISHGLCLIKSFSETAGDRDVLLASFEGSL